MMLLSRLCAVREYVLMNIRKALLPTGFLLCGCDRLHLLSQRPFAG